MTEQQIVEGLIKGDRQAQTLCYTQYRTTWFMICLRYQSDEPSALDSLQNALIKIFSKVGQFNNTKGTFKSWSSRIVINENLMALRKKSAQIFTEDISESFELFDEQASPLEQLSAKELTSLIQKLPDGYRTIFNMYVIEGYTHGEIADELRISIGTSKSQLFKARKLLQQQLEVLI